MAERRPLVDIGGPKGELPSGDTLAPSLFTPGSNGQFMGVSAGVPGWVAAPSGGAISQQFAVRMDAAVSLGSGWSRPSWSSAPGNPGGGYWNSGTPKKVEIVDGGTWLIGFSGVIDFAGNRAIYPDKNHATAGNGSAVWKYYSLGASWPTVTAFAYFEPVTLTSGDDLYLSLYSVSGTYIYEGATLWGFKIG